MQMGQDEFLRKRQLPTFENWVRKDGVIQISQFIAFVFSDSGSWLAYLQNR
jgi:hypothetical protein